MSHGPQVATEEYTITLNAGGSVCAPDIYRRVYEPYNVDGTNLHWPVSLCTSHLSESV